MSDELRLAGLTVRNFMRVGLVQLTFRNGEMCVIGGKNAQGKSAILKAFEALMGGKRAIPADPVKHGAKAAEVIADLGTHTAKLSITSKGPKLVVRTKAGLPVSAPMELFKTFCSHVGFRPLKFMGMDRHDQAKVLMDLAGLDFSATDKEYKETFAQRTFVGKEVTSLEAQLAGLPFDESAPKEEVDVGDLMSQIQKANDANLRRNHQVKSRENHERRGTEYADRIADMLGEVEELQKLMAGEIEAAKAIEVQDVVDSDSLVEQIENAQDINKAVRANENHVAIKESRDASRDEYAELTATLDGFKQQKADALAAATFPVDGLDLDEDNLPTFNGISTDDISGAEQLQVSTAVGLALNPKLKVLLIDDGEKLDLDSLAALDAFAKEHDAVVIMARVSQGDECSVEIVDGQVAEVSDDG